MPHNETWRLRREIFAQRTQLLMRYNNNNILYRSIRQVLRERLQQEGKPVVPRIIEAFKN